MAKENRGMEMEITTYKLEARLKEHNAFKAGEGGELTISSL